MGGPPGVEKVEQTRGTAGQSQNCGVSRSLNFPGLGVCWDKIWGLVDRSTGWKKEG